MCARSKGRFLDLLRIGLTFLILVGSSSAVADSLFTEGAPTISTSDERPTPQQQLPKLTHLVKALKPAVVNISVEGEGAADDGASGKEKKEGGAAPQQSSGSGFIVQPDGYIVTSNHVIEKAKRIIVRLADDKNDYIAEVLGNDSKTDIALLKINAGRKLQAVFIGDSDALEVGEWVVAIGNQFQLGQTVTAGIVSAKSRRVQMGGVSGPYDAFIQTDASINPGSSGGPLFNTRGQVVGINTAIFSPGRAQFGGTGFNIGIGFAIPINLGREVLVQLKDSGKVKRGLLGVLIQRVDKDVAAVLGLTSPDGALVSDVMPGTPAASAGIMRKDVIINFNGAPVRDHDDLPLMVARTGIGAAVPVEVIRARKVLKLVVTISELKEQTKVETGEAQPDALGLIVESITDELAASLSLSAPYGVRVVSIESGSLAEGAGITKDDVIEELAGMRFKNSASWRDFVGKEFGTPASVEKLYLALVRRKQGTRYVVLKRTAVAAKDKPHSK